MKSKFALLLAAGLMASSLSAMAGSPDGLQILLLRSAASAEYDAVVDQYLSRYRIGGAGFDCLDAQLSLAAVTHEVSVKGVSADTAYTAATKAAARKTMASKLEHYRDAERDHGFDGALAYRKEGEQLVFYGIAAMEGEPAHVSKLPLTAIKDDAKVNRAICEVLVRIPVNAEP